MHQENITIIIKVKACSFEWCIVCAQNVSGQSYKVKIRTFVTFLVRDMFHVYLNRREFHFLLL